tara:strand:- start:10934 stop:11128 length:195 start_codon:yes stop_codon:yes gene_type:complete
MSTIIRQKPVEFYSYKTVTLLYDSIEEVWKVVGVKENEPNTVIYKGESQDLAVKFFDTIILNDK